MYALSATECCIGNLCSYLTSKNMSTATFKTSLQKNYLLTIRNIFVKHATPKLSKEKFLAKQYTESSSSAQTMLQELDTTLVNNSNLRPWQTRTHCCRHKGFSVCPSCGPQNICVRDTKMFDFVQKHFVSATNVSQFAQPISHLCTQNKQQTVTNNSLFNILTSIYSNAVPYISHFNGHKMYFPKKIV